MTWLELYNAVCYRVWGLQTPPEGAQALLQGQYGIIATIHRNIQKWKDYWFMELSTTIPVIAGTKTYALPTGFKHLEKDGLRFINSYGAYEEPLSLLLPGDYAGFTDPTQTEDYPRGYEIFGDTIELTLMPASNQTLYMRYLGYLARPPAVFDATNDALTINGNDVICNYAVAEICTIQEELGKANLYRGYGDTALAMLNQEDVERRRSGFTQIRCS